MYPVIDLHCDLLSYLIQHPSRTAYDTHKIGAAIPHLMDGHVKLQIMAVFTHTQPGSSEKLFRQLEAYDFLGHLPEIRSVSSCDLSLVLDQSGSEVLIYHAIENASGLFEEEEDMKKGWERMDVYLQKVGKPLYISLTHHTENRFGGGNNCHHVGLKSDGKTLLDWMDKKGIALDISHASDSLAEQIFDYIDRQRLAIPLIASHSNFRFVCNHNRNLPEEFVREIIHREGLIGLNFFRAYLHPTDPEAIFQHLSYAWEQGAGEVIAFGADFFDPSTIVESKRFPLYFSSYQNAGFYPELLRELMKREVKENQVELLAGKNVIRFIKHWNSN